MRQQLRLNAYLRMSENRFVTSESSSVDPAWWARCEDAGARPLVADRTLAVWVGVDASVKRDSTAIVADATAKKVRLVWHQVFQPSAADPLDFEAAVEETLLELRNRFSVQEVRFVSTPTRWWPSRSASRRRGSRWSNSRRACRT